MCPTPVLVGIVPTYTLGFAGPKYLSRSQVLPLYSFLVDGSVLTANAWLVHRGRDEHRRCSWVNGSQKDRSPRRRAWVLERAPGTTRRRRSGRKAHDSVTRVRF